MKVPNIVQEVLEHFKNSRHSGNGMCLKIALWAYGRDTRVVLFYNSGHVICGRDGVCFDGGGVIMVTKEDLYMDISDYGQRYFLHGFGPYLTEIEKTILKEYFNMSLIKQIKMLEESIATKTNFISDKQKEIQPANQALHDARQEAQAVLLEWQKKIDDLAMSINTMVAEITKAHETKIWEEGRLSLLQEQYAQSGEKVMQIEPA